MKRAGDLYAGIAAPENLRLAFWKASRGKRHNPDVVAFGERLDREVASLSAELAAGSVRVGDYRTFTIHDPKERVICAASFRERVLHHAIINRCEPVFESYQISDSYACRKGKGTYKALDRAQGFARRYRYALKLDVRKYFDSIDHGVLEGLLARRFKEPPLLDLFGRLIASYHTAPGKGVPIGNLTSQYFANHYLAVLDHFVKEELRVPAYVRYMDDCVLWGQERGALKAWRREVEGFLEQRLHLVLKPPVLAATGEGLSFLGYRVYPAHRTLTRRSRNRFARKLAACERELCAGAITEREAAARVEPLLAFAAQASTRGLRRSVGRAASKARTGSIGAAAGTTSPATCGRPIATTGTRATATTTWASASSSAQEGSGRTY